MTRIEKPVRGLVMLGLSLAVAVLADAQSSSAAPGDQQPPNAAPSGPLVVERIRSGAFVAPDIKVTEIDGKTGTLVGGYGGWLTDETFFVGAGGSWLVNGPNDMDMYYVGFVAGWRVPVGQSVRFGVRGLVGGGEATLWDVYSYDSSPGRPMPRSDRPGYQPPFSDYPGTRHYGFTEGFFVFEPQADVTIRVTDWLALTAGAGYRVIGASHDVDERLRGVTGSFAIQFGGGR